MKSLRIFSHEYFDLIDVISFDCIKLIVQLRNQIHHELRSKWKTAFLTSKNRNNINKNNPVIDGSLNCIYELQFQLSEEMFSRDGFNQEWKDAK